MLIKVLTLLFMLAFSKSWGQAILQWTTFGNAGTETTEPSTFNDLNLASSNLTLGAGITSAGNVNRFGGSSWSPSLANAVTGNDYIEFIITPTAGCSVTPTSFVFSWDRSNSGPFDVTLRSSADGFVTNLGSVTGMTVGLNIGNIITITGLTNIGTTTFRLYGYGATAGTGTGGFDCVAAGVNVQLNGTTSCSGSNNITTGVISSPPFNLASCASTATGTAAFTSSGTFVLGNIYTVQLSNASGSFVAPVNIGTLTSNANSGTITFTVPPGTTAGTGYVIRVISSNPSVTGSNSSAFTITSGCALSCPSITGALINACGGGCNTEGSNEMIFLNSGSYNIPVNSTNIDITFGGTNFTSSFAPQPSVISNLNTLAGCPGLFVDVSSGTIPANKPFILMNQTSCFDNNFSGFCSSAPIYVIFSTDASWSPSGFFTNSGGIVKTFVTNFSAISSSCAATSYSYLPSNLIGGDGAAIMYSSGNSAPNYINSGCTPPYIILPIELIDFYVTKNNALNDVVWKVAAEENIEYYIIEKSNDWVNFEPLGYKPVNYAIQSHIKTYILTDESPYSDITYYRLSVKEFQGIVKVYNTIYVDESTTDWKIHYYQNDQNLIIEFKNLVPKNSTIYLFDLSGKLLAQETVNQPQTKINTSFFTAGIYFIKIDSPYKTENFKVVVTEN